MRPSTHHQRRDIKSRTWAMLDQIGISEFVPHTRVMHAALSKYGAPPRDDGDLLQKEDQYIPVDVMFDAELRTGPMVTRLIADMLGFDLVAKDAPAPTTAFTIEAVLHVSKECADVAAAYVERSADGDIDRLDRQVIGREIDEAITALTRLRKAVG